MSRELANIADYCFNVEINKKTMVCQPEASRSPRSRASSAATSPLGGSTCLTLLV